VFQLVKIAQAKSEMSGQKFPPLKPLHFCPRIFAFRPATLPEYLEGRTQRKMSFPFSAKIGRAQIRKARNIFLWGCRAERGGGGGAFIG